MVNGSQSRRIVAKLNIALRRTSKYFRRWHIKINPSKTEAAFFPSDGKRRRLPRAPLTIGDEAVHFGNSLKYLGVVLDAKLNFAKHIAAARSKGLAACCSLYPIMGRRSRLTAKNKLLLVKQVIRPIMSYAAPVWTLAARTHIISLQRIQSRAIKTALSMPRRSPTAEIHAIADISLLDKYIADSREAFRRRCTDSDRPILRQIAEDWALLGR